MLLDVVACVLAVGLQHADLLASSDVSTVTALREVFDLFAAVHVSDSKHVVQLVQAITALFEHVASAVDYHLLATALSPGLAIVLRAYSEQSSSKAPLFSASDELLTHFFEAAKRTHRGMYDSHLLTTLSGVLAVTLLHGKKSVKNKTVTFWCETFGAQNRALEYPQVLHGVLAQLKHGVSSPFSERVVLTGVICRVKSSCRGGAMTCRELRGTWTMNCLMHRWGS